MESTDSTTSAPPPPPVPPPPGGPGPSGTPGGVRVLRRSRTDRVAAGVAGGLGEYLGLDPVLFRVLFAVSAFFGGAGILAYVLAWAAIPEAGTQHATVDGWVAALRRRNIPFWAIAVLAGLVLWGVAFSWWAPGPFLPVLVVVVVLVVIFGRRGAPPATGPAPDGLPAPGQAGDPNASTVDLTKAGPGATGAGAAPPPAAAPPPDWIVNTRAWIAESRQASRERRRRAFPVRVATLLALVLALVGLGVADAVTGIALPLYFWTGGAIVAAGLLTGLALRRTPWSMAPLLIPALAGMVAFGATSASLHDGIGDTGWAPAASSQLHGEYRLAFGRATLNLTALGSVPEARHVDVRVAAGQVRILLPSTLNVTVNADVRIGDVEVNGTQVADTNGGSIYRTGGYHARQTVPAPDGATGAPIVIDVHLADGQIQVERPA